MRLLQCSEVLWIRDFNAICTNIFKNDEDIALRFDNSTHLCLKFIGGKMRLFILLQQSFGHLKRPSNDF